MPAQTQKQQHGSLLANLAFNIIIPTLILTKASSDDYLGPTWAIVVALAFPVGYGLKDFIKTREPNFFSILGVVSVLLTGGISLLELDPKYIAIKEAAIPASLGLATLLSMRTRWPLVRTFLYNPSVLDVEKVARALEQRGNEQAFERRLDVSSYMVAGSFFLSATLNYILARVILVSDPGTPAYAAELGRMTALSFPVIALPSMVVLMGALWYLLRGISHLAGLDLEEIFVDPAASPKTEEN